MGALRGWGGRSLPEYVWESGGLINQMGFFPRPSQGFYHVNIHCSAPKTKESMQCFPFLVTLWERIIFLLIRICKLVLCNMIATSQTGY